MKAESYLSVEAVKESEYFEGELKRFVEKYSGQTLNCGKCDHQIHIREENFRINVYVPKSLYEKAKAMLGGKVERKDFKDNSITYLRATNSVVAYAQIICPECGAGYGNSERDWEQNLE